MIHPLADCLSSIPETTRVWQFSIILAQAKIGENCNICSHCFIENDVVIGNNVTIKNGVYLWDGIVLEDDVFVGPNVTFTNDNFPQSGNHQFKLSRTTVCKGASIGAGAVILGGLTIGAGAMIGAGSVVTKDIPAFELWVGNPAKFVREMTTQP